MQGSLPLAAQFMLLPYEAIMTAKWIRVKVIEGQHFGHTGGYYTVRYESWEIVPKDFGDVQLLLIRSLQIPS